MISCYVITPSPLTFSPTRGIEPFLSVIGQIDATTFDELLHRVALALLFVGLFILAFS